MSRLIQDLIHRIQICNSFFKNDSKLKNLNKNHLLENDLYSKVQYVDFTEKLRHIKRDTVKGGEESVVVYFY